MTPEFYVGENERKQPDPILGVSKLLEADPRPGKINAGVGVLKDELGKTYTPSAIEAAWRLMDLGSVDYLSPSGEEEFLGDRRFLEVSSQMVFGKEGENLLENKRLAAIGTIGGTGAVAVMAQLVKTIAPDAPVVIGTPTWPNHLQIIKESSGLNVITYTQVRKNSFNLDEAVKTIEESLEEAIILFHAGKTHNPTGVNPATLDDWNVIADAVGNRRVLFDTPYIGLGEGLYQDTQAIGLFLNRGIPVAVAVSYAKNCGLYNQRPGALLIPSSNKENARELQRLLNYIARSNYSSPPAFGERLVAKMMSDPTLFSRWQNDLTRITCCLQERRKIFSILLPEFSYIKEQSGLFGILPVSEEQVLSLRKEFAIYMPVSGRVNFGGITLTQMPQFCAAIKKVQK